jgi:hypothetical protein
MPAISKSFLVLFFKKEPLTSRPNQPLPRKRPILNPVRLGRIMPEPTSFILFVGLEITLKPFHVRITLER